jgi:hypothetical protein
VVPGGRPRPFALQRHFPLDWRARVNSPDSANNRSVWYPISAIDGYTPAEPRGPIALPGRYTARLTANGGTISRTFTVKMDPRVTTSAADLELQFDLSMRIKLVLDQRDRLTTPERGRALGDLESLYRSLQGSDQAPNPTVVGLARERLAALEPALGSDR